MPGIFLPSSASWALSCKGSLVNAASEVLPALSFLGHSEVVLSLSSHRALHSPLRIAPPVCGAWHCNEGLLRIFHPSNPRGGYYHLHFKEEKLRLRKPHQDPSVAGAKVWRLRHNTFHRVSRQFVFVSVGGPVCSWQDTPLTPFLAWEDSVFQSLIGSNMFIIHYSLMSFFKSLSIFVVLSPRCMTQVLCMSCSSFCSACLQECLKPKKPVCGVCRSALAPGVRATELERQIESTETSCHGCRKNVCGSKMEESSVFLWWEGVKRRAVATLFPTLEHD